MWSLVASLLLQLQYSISYGNQIRNTSPIFFYSSCTHFFLHKSKSTRAHLTVHSVIFPYLFYSNIFNHSNHYSFYVLVNTCIWSVCCIRSPDFIAPIRLTNLHIWLFTNLITYILCLLINYVHISLSLLPLVLILVADPLVVITGVVLHSASENFSTS